MCWRWTYYMLDVSPAESQWVVYYTDNIVFKNFPLLCITGGLLYASHMGVFVWQSGLMHRILHHEDHMPESANFDADCFLIKCFSDTFVYCTHRLHFEAHEAMFVFSPWLRCVVGIHLLCSSIASTGTVHVKTQLLLIAEGPKPDAVLRMLRMFLRMLNTVAWLIPASAVSWHLTQPPVCLYL